MRGNSFGSSSSGDDAEEEVNDKDDMAWRILRKTSRGLPLYAARKRHVEAISVKVSERKAGPATVASVCGGASRNGRSTETKSHAIFFANSS